MIDEHAAGGAQLHVVGQLQRPAFDFDLELRLLNECGQGGYGFHRLRVLEACEGPAAIQAAMQGLLDMGARSLDIEPLEVREAGDLTIEYGRYALGIEPEGAEPVTDVGKYIVVHESQNDGSTKIVLDIFNSNLPATA